MALGNTLESTPRASDSVWRDWVSRASGTDEAISLPAVDARERLVGHVGASWTDEITSLSAMWVEPDHRGRGLGARLLDAVLAWGDTVHPMSEVRLSVVPTQEIAPRLYRSHGFVETGKVSPLKHTPGAIYHEISRPRRGAKS